MKILIQIDISNDDPELDAKINQVFSAIIRHQLPMPTLVSSQMEPYKDAPIFMRFGYDILWDNPIPESKIHNNS